MNTEMKETDSNQSNHADQPVDTLKADQLTDLEPEGEVVGGIIGPTGYVLCRTTGGVVTNHNETVAEDEVTETEALADLPVATEQETQVAGGIGHVKVFDGRDYAAFNHNETVVEDGVAEAAELADLSVAVPQAEEVKGGVGRAAARWEQVITGDIPALTA